MTRGDWRFYWPGLVRAAVPTVVLVCLVAGWWWPEVALLFSGCVIGQWLAEWDERGRKRLERELGVQPPPWRPS